MGHTCVQWLEKQAKLLKQAKQDDDKKRFFFFLHSLQMTRFHFYGWMTTTFSPFVLSLTEDNKVGLFITFATTKQTYFYHLDKIYKSYWRSTKKKVHFLPLLEKKRSTGHCISTIIDKWQWVKLTNLFDYFILIPGNLELHEIAMHNAHSRCAVEVIKAILMTLKP